MNGKKKKKKLSENLVNGRHTSKPYDMVIKSSMVRDKLAWWFFTLLFISLSSGLVLITDLSSWTNCPDFWKSIFRSDILSHMFIKTEPFSAYDQTLISVKYILLGKNVHQNRTGKFESGWESLRVGGKLKVGREVWEWAGKFESGKESLRVGGRVREWEGEFESGRVCLICKMEFESGMWRMMLKQRKPVFVVVCSFIVLFFVVFFVFLFWLVFTNCRMETVYRKIGNNVGPIKNIFFCTYTFIGIHILSSPSFKAIASTSRYMHPNRSLLLAYLIHF